jgi:hypothetical protein
MPKFVGQTIPGSSRIEDNMLPSSKRVKLTYSQARLMPPSHVMCSLDTTDRGSRGSLAKRWYIWYATPQAILTCPHSTANMMARAQSSLPV